MALEEATDLMLPISNFFSIVLLPLRHPVAAYVFSLIFPSAFISIPPSVNIIINMK